MGAGACSCCGGSGNVIDDADGVTLVTCSSCGGKGYAAEATQAPPLSGGGMDRLGDPAVAQGGEELPGDPRPRQLSDFVAGLIDGNNARASDVALLGGKTLRYGLTFTVAWTIRSQWQSQTHFGDQTANAVRHNGNQAVERAAQNEADAIVAEGHGLARLHERVRNSPEQVFREADGEINLRLGRSHAHCYTCPNSFCRGGRVTCFTCGGTGGAWVSVTRYDSSNRPYSVSEWRTCGDCGGSGTHRCNTCGGHGCLTYRAEVNSFAMPAVTFGFDNGANHAAVRRFVMDTSMNRLGADYLDTPLREFRKLSSDKAELHYAVTALVTEADITVQARDYHLRSFGKRNLLILHPPIFDPLLESLAAKIAAAAGKAKRLAVFAEAQSKPLTAELMRKYAANIKLDAEAAVVEAAAGLLSPALAAKLGTPLLHLLKGVCPAFSLIPWLLIGGFGVYAALMMGVERLGYDWMEQAGIAAGVILTLGWLVSFSVTGWRRRGIPKPFRRARTERKPMIATALLMAAAMMAGSNLDGQARTELRAFNQALWRQGAGKAAAGLAWGQAEYQRLKLEGVGASLAGLLPARQETASPAPAAAQSTHLPPSRPRIVTPAIPGPVIGDERVYKTQVRLSQLGLYDARPDGIADEALVTAASKLQSLTAKTDKAKFGLNVAAHAEAAIEDNIRLNYPDVPPLAVQGFRNITRAALSSADAAPMGQAVTAASLRPGTPVSWTSADGRRQGTILVTTIDPAAKCVTMSQEIVFDSRSDMMEKQTACMGKQPGGWELR